MLNAILGGFNYICSIVTLALTALMLVSYRKPKRFQASNQYFSIGLSLVTLILFVLISGARLNFAIGMVLFILGAVFGVVRGMTVKMYTVDEEVIHRNSMLSLAGWGGSLAFSSIFSSFDSAILAAIGLIPLFFSTGTQIGTDCILLLRRRSIKPSATEVV